MFGMRTLKMSKGRFEGKVDIKVWIVQFDFGVDDRKCFDRKSMTLSLSFFMLFLCVCMTSLSNN